MFGKSVHFSCFVTLPKIQTSTKGEVLVEMRREVLSRVTSRMKRRFKPREMLRRAVKQRRQSLATDQ
jgi:hypothetical protein